MQILPPLPAPSSAAEFELSFRGTPEQVRAALREIRAKLRGTLRSGDTAANAELVLAEVFNNIVEHALQGRDPAQSRISVICRRETGRLRFVVIDQGAAMPSHRVPDSDLPVPGGANAEIAEGGYGWSLVHMLTEDVQYRRMGRQNWLSFLIKGR